MEDWKYTHNTDESLSGPLDVVQLPDQSTTPTLITVKKSIIRHEDILYLQQAFTGHSVCMGVLSESPFSALFSISASIQSMFILDDTCTVYIRYFFSSSTYSSYIHCLPQKFTQILYLNMDVLLVHSKLRNDNRCLLSASVIYSLHIYTCIPTHIFIEYI